MIKIIKVNNDKYEVIGKTIVNTKYSSDELKKQWNADNILRNRDMLYMVRKLIEAEFEDICDVWYICVYFYSYSCIFIREDYKLWPE